MGYAPALSTRGFIGHHPCTKLYKNVMQHRHSWYLTYCSKSYFTDMVDLEALRARLRRMNEWELLRFGGLRCLCARQRLTSSKSSTGSS